MSQRTINIQAQLDGTINLSGDCSGFCSGDTCGGGPPR